MDRAISNLWRGRVSTVCAALAGLLVLTGQAANATEPSKKEGYKYGGHKNEDHGSNIPGLSAKHIMKVLDHAADINLDDSQKKKIGDIYIKSKAEAAAVHAEVEVVVSGYMTLYKKGKIDEEAIREYADQMGALRTRLLFTNLKAMNDVKMVLTSEQRETIHMIYRTHGKGKKKE